MYDVFVINLDAQTSRWAFMQRQFEALGLPIRRLPAVNGYDPATRGISQVAPFAPLPNGEVGCFESHRNAWRKIVARDLPGAFILEDDVAVGADFGQVDLPTEMLANIDIIKLDTCRWKAGYGPVCHVPAAGRVLRPLLGSETSAGCYFITRRGAGKMLRHSQGYFMPVDTMMFNLESRAFHDLTTLKILPAIAAQLRFILPQEEQAEEIANSMQAKRRLKIDPLRKMTPARRAKLYLRRLVDWDFGLIRRRRAKAFLKRATIATPVEAVPFFTPDRAHIDAALPALHRNSPGRAAASRTYPRRH